MNAGIGPDAEISRELILIGADGFIGSELAGYFKAAGWKLYSTVFTRSPEKGEIALDVTRPEDFRVLPAGMPVLHIAGLPDQGTAASRMRRVHVGGMRNLVAWAKKSRCPHIVTASSISVYGNATVGLGRSESTTRRRLWNPLLSPLIYGRTKARAERILEGSGIPWSAPRLPAVFGPGDIFLTPQLFDLLSRESRLMPPVGDKPVSIMPVDLLGPLYEQILLKGPLNAALNAAGAHVSWKDLVESYAAVWGLPVRSGIKPRWTDFVRFGDPGLQMACYYGAFGAEFPDGEIRRRINWEPGGDWRNTVNRAATAYGNRKFDSTSNESAAV